MAQGMANVFMVDGSVPDLVIVVEYVLGLGCCHPHGLRTKVKLSYGLILDACAGLQVWQPIEHHHY